MAVQVLENGWIKCEDYLPEKMHPNKKNGVSSKQCLLIVKDPIMEKYYCFVVYYNFAKEMWVYDFASERYIPVLWQYIPKFDNILPKLSKLKTIKRDLETGLKKKKTAKSHTKRGWGYDPATYYGNRDLKYS